MTLDINLETYRNDNAMYVHRKELVSENGQYFVYVLENNAAKKCPVVLGKTQGLYHEITQGLKAGDLLISGGSQMVHDGSKVNQVAPIAGTVGAE